MTAQALERPESAGRFFADLKAQFSGPSLTDARTWAKLDIVQRKALVRLAGYDNAKPHPHAQRGTIAILAGRSWSELTEKQRHKIKDAARKLGGLLAGFEGVHVARTERG
ncbi:hypothetical protein [Saccharospirillum salsuginis]|nr:hypothetical protein [Saccharospirillum salsuginis]